MSLRTYWNKHLRECEIVERLAFELEQLGWRFRHVYGDSLLIEALSERELTKLTLVLFRFNCEICAGLDDEDAEEIFPQLPDDDDIEWKPL